MVMICDVNIITHWNEGYPIFRQTHLELHRYSSLKERRRQRPDEEIVGVAVHDGGHLVPFLNRWVLRQNLQETMGYKPTYIYSISNIIYIYTY